MIEIVFTVVVVVFFGTLVHSVWKSTHITE